MNLFYFMNVSKISEYYPTLQYLFHCPRNYKLSLQGDENVENYKVHIFKLQVRLKFIRAKNTVTEILLFSTSICYIGSLECDPVHSYNILSTM